MDTGSKQLVKIQHENFLFVNKKKNKKKTKQQLIMATCSYKINCFLVCLGVKFELQNVMLNLLPRQNLRVSA